MNQATDQRASGDAQLGPVPLGRFDHVSVPCRDLDEAMCFFVDVLGGEVRVKTPIFAEVRLGGTLIGFGAKGTTFMEPSTEYPHIGFSTGPAELAQLKAWLTQCGIPTSNYWTRYGIEALMFFRDPSGNVFEVYCPKGFPGADGFPRGPAAGHDIAVDINAIRYDTWKRPAVQRSRRPVPD
ncbi:MAG: VOC family protein [Candidatus Lustribacter sp.]|jgi:catechol 2,3-dioxygenase-like lactoylglutathione lyase family enzyme